MNSTQLTPLLLLAIGCSSTPGTGDHERAPTAGDMGNGAAKAGRNAGSAGSNTTGTGNVSVGNAGGTTSAEPADGTTVTKGGASTGSAASGGTSGGGTAGVGGASNNGGAVTGGATASTEIDDGTAVGTLDRPCSPEGSYACAGHARKGQLVCSAGKWASNGTCLEGYNCDSTPGIGAGSCVQIVTQCSVAGARYCNGTSVEQCGVDLVTSSIVESCDGAKSVCLDATCVACNPKAKQCSENGVQTCSASGAWGTAVACTNKACVDGQCEGECEPGQKQCNGSTPRTCSDTGQWEIQAVCSGATFCSAGVCVDCPGTGGPSMVGLPLGYCIDSTEVTRAQYAAWLDRTKAATIAAQDSANCDWNTTFTPSSDWASPLTSPNSPVAYVDWCDAFAYCKGVGKRLCGKIGGGSNDFLEHSNAELSQWYAACTSNGTDSYPYGNAYDGTTCNGRDAGKGATVAVGTMANCMTSASGYSGVYDLSGNVAEWEDSCSGTGKASCNMRGGAFSSFTSGMVCGGGGWDLRDQAENYNGFRCCAP